LTAWIEVNLDNLKNNIHAIRRKVGPAVKIMAMIKANGYGHGEEMIAKYCLKYGIDQLAVSSVQEGIALRRMGIDMPVLITGTTLPEHAEMIVKYRLTPTVFTLDTAQYLQEAARKGGQLIPCHVRVDIGLTSFGVRPGECIPFIEKILAMEGLQLEGLYTHFSSSYGNDQSMIARELLTFQEILQELKR